MLRSHTMSGIHPTQRRRLTTEDMDMNTNPLAKADIASQLSGFVQDNRYLFFAPVCRVWKQAWVLRPTVTQAITPDTSAPQLLSSFDSGLGCTTAVCDAAARLGRLDLLQAARARGCPWDSGTMRWAAWGGHLVVCQWAKQAGCPWSEDTCSWAAFKGHQHVLAWARSNGCPWDETTCSEAARGNQLDVLRTSRANGAPWDARTSAYAVAHPEVFNWVAQNKCPFDASGFAMAAMAGNLGVIQYARSRGWQWDESTCRAAALGGHLQTLQWCRANGCPWDFETIVYAEEAGHDGLADWAREAGCPGDPEGESGTHDDSEY